MKNGPLGPVFAWFPAEQAVAYTRGLAVAFTLDREVVSIPGHHQRMGTKALGARASLVHLAPIGAINTVRSERRAVEVCGPEGLREHVITHWAEAVPVVWVPVTSLTCRGGPQAV